ncbi:MAG: hypothetical protein D6706_04735 [Chloroflexi bacterium]|nr:MAG: hypothetical protein D6706_04735 [Chloroflexota bacterium]
MQHTVLLANNTQITLDASHLIQAGGEGIIFAAGNTAIKLYHHPQKQHIKKLAYLLDEALNKKLPPEVLAPCALIFNIKGKTIGFQMPRLPRGSQPIRKLTSAVFCRQHGISMSRQIMLLTRIYHTLNRLHQLGIVVGDLNDRNLFFVPDGSPQVWWVDVDSYQFGGFPCPVATAEFLDPSLYNVPNFGKRPYFTPLTDWYAFLVLLVKTLLLVHPYGGTHHQYKSLTTRAQAGIPVRHPDVTKPPHTRPPEILPDTWLELIDRVFARGERVSVSQEMMAELVHNMRICAQCGTSYACQRPSCPVCQRPTKMPVTQKTDQWTEWLAHLPGNVVATWRENGRFQAITRKENLYTLSRRTANGQQTNIPLFTGRPGYRFGWFQQRYLAVNPPLGKQLLVLDTNGEQPQKITLTETVYFRETAVFATTPHALYRIAGTWIMRGQIQNGLYLETPIATAHRAQTWFTSSPHHDLLIGYHRLFTDYQFFCWHNQTTWELPVPPLAMGESLQEVTFHFQPDHILIERQIRHGTNIFTDSYPIYLAIKKDGSLSIHP